MKICVLLEGKTNCLRGEFLAIHNRMKYLVKDPSVSVTIYNIQRYYDNLTNRIRGNKQIELKKDFVLDGIHYHCLYYKRSYLDYFMRSISNYQTTIEVKRVKHYENLFTDCDLIFAHSLYTGLIALDLKQKNGIPFVMMWHGSSIHTMPFQNKTTFTLTKKVLQNSNHNFFVSKELFETANQIVGSECVGSVSPNGIDTEVYYCYDDNKREKTAESLQIDLGKKNVAFIGNYLPIKNVKYLPMLFSSIYKDNKETCFHIIGNGDFVGDFKGLDLPITFWGNQLPDKMPDLYNCMDLIVLPSINEGLPMTCLESTACGTAFVGSRVGGIAEVVGVDNTVPLSPTFETDFANLCKEKLANKDVKFVQLSEQYRVEHVVAMEKKVLEEVLNGEGI